MAEELLGPDLSATISAPEPYRERIQATLSPDGERLKEEVEKMLWEALTRQIENLVSQSGYSHDGFHFSWELACIFIDDDEIVVPASINVNVKSDDFDFFDALLQEEVVLNSLLQTIENVLIRYLEGQGISSSDFTVIAKSDGFGYG